MLGLAAQAAGADWLKSQIDVPTLAAVIMAAVLAFEGYQKRKTAKHQATLICPHSAEGMQDAIRAIEKACEQLHDSSERTLRILEAQDADGVPRIYSRDQGRELMGSLRELLRAQGEIWTAVSVIKSRLNRGDGDQ